MATGNIQPDARKSQYSGDLERIYRINGYGDYKSQGYQMLYGLNYNTLGIQLPTATDQVGLTFFTRPDLNFHTENITQDRCLSVMNNNQDLTYSRAIRALLDPWGSDNNGYRSRLCNPKQAFITPFTNLVTSVSGHMDPQVQTYGSKEGIMGEAWGMIDGIYEHHGPWQMTVTMHNIEGGLPLFLHDMWLRYAVGVYHGKLFPYPWNNMMSRIDYVTRPYRFILDPGRQYVKYWACAGVAFPTAVPWGGVFDFDSNDNFQRSLEKVSVNYQCFGVYYNDPIILKEFNQTVAKFNPDMKIANADKLATEEIRLKSSNYYRVPINQRELFNGFCYPLVHPFTQELCWFVSKEDHARCVNGIATAPNGFDMVGNFTGAPETAESFQQSYFSGASEIDTFSANTINMAVRAGQTNRG